jgi:hypothetical protein
MEDTAGRSQGQSSSDLELPLHPLPAPDGPPTAACCASVRHNRDRPSSLAIGLTAAVYMRPLNNNLGEDSFRIRKASRPPRIGPSLC